MLQRLYSRGRAGATSVPYCSVRSTPEAECRKLLCREQVLNGAVEWLEGCICGRLETPAPPDKFEINALEIRLDSLLIVNQMKGLWNVKVFFFLSF